MQQPTEKPQPYRLHNTEPAWRVRNASEMAVGQIGMISDVSTEESNGETVLRVAGGLVSLTDPNHVWFPAPAFAVTTRGGLCVSITGAD